MPTSVSMAKNGIRRALMAILDEYPDERVIGDLWDHFYSRCAYCGRQLSPSVRGKGLDHLIPAAQGGSNQAANLVLACTDCNDNRRDLPWAAFLKSVSEPAHVPERSGRIEAWVARHGGSARQRNDDLRAIAQPYIEAVLQACDDAKLALRKIRDGGV